MIRSHADRRVERDSSAVLCEESPAPPPPRRFKVDSLTAWPHHRSGWGPCGQVLQQLASPDGGVLLVDSVERLIRDSIVLDEPWVGFVHKALLAPAHLETLYGEKRDASLPAMMATEVWRRNIEQCRGLFCLSDHLGAYLQPRVACPVDVVAHATSFDCLPFDFEAFRRSEHKTLLLIGHWLRRFQSFYDLSAPDFRKCLLKCQDEQLYERLHGVLRNNGSVEVLPWQPKSSYDRLLSRSVVFLDLIDASANNSVIECLARNTPLLVNPHPAVIEYLGPDYPLYFDDLAHAASLLNIADLRRGHEYLCRSAALKDRVRFESFRRAVTESAIYQSL
jgi:hypothetical protein